ncbi:hypothetical protein K504DRAFT_240354 [Pleomassaria siparia CBS 279.74]|uniref:Uncharacterized protein n=1 Tax=Pleomassaria siparia CBS 279.74 TaxID=1314801 RepID=A0A6G1KDU0_9PLEO|nr:hypothetical protein K504DRAFT_240354 [Pleomassaria siparia CBS 279.74]
MSSQETSDWAFAQKLQDELNTHDRALMESHVPTNTASTQEMSDADVADVVKCDTINDYLFAQRFQAQFNADVTAQLVQRDRINTELVQQLQDGDFTLSDEHVACGRQLGKTYEQLHEEKDAELAEKIHKAEHQLHPVDDNGSDERYGRRLQEVEFKGRLHNLDITPQVEAMKNRNIELQESNAVL